MNKKIRSLLCIVMVMLTVALSVPTAFAAKAELKAPANLKASSSTSTITLNWDAAESATGYRVSYLNKCGKWKTYKDVKDTTITFSNLPAGTKYTFRVMSYYQCTHKSKVTWSKGCSTIQTATAPKVPCKIKLTSDASKLKIEWTASKGATGYAVYYKHLGKWKEIKTTSATYVTVSKLCPAVIYTFAVRPYVETKSGWVWGDYKEFTGGLAPKATTVTASSPEKNTVKLSWTKVCAADGYAVYYKVGKCGYKLYGTYDKAQEITITGLKAGKYKFVVRPYIKTSVGKVCGPYTPVDVEVSGLLPCGCEPVCAYCGPNTKTCKCRPHGGHRR